VRAPLELDRFSMKAEKFREMTGHFRLNELGDPHHFVNTQIQVAHSRVQYIAISRKVKDSALRYFFKCQKEHVFWYSRVCTHEANSLIFFILHSISTKIVHNAR